MKAALFLMFFLFPFAGFSQMEKLKGLWITDNSELLYITDESSNGSYLFKESKANANSFFQQGDTLSFKTMHLGREIDTIWYDNSHDLRLVSLTDSLLVVAPISVLSQAFFANSDTLVFTKQRYKPDTTVEFEKLIYTSSLAVPFSGKLKVQVDNCKRISIDRTTYLVDHGDYLYAQITYEADSARSGYYEGTLSDSLYKELVHLVRISALNTGTFTTDSSKANSSGMYGHISLIVNHNNTRKYLLVSETPEFAFELIQLLTEIGLEENPGITLNRVK